MFTFDLTQK